MLTYQPEIGCKLTVIIVICAGIGMILAKCHATVATKPAPEIILNTQPEEMPAESEQVSIVLWPLTPLPKLDEAPTPPAPVVTAQIDQPWISERQAVGHKRKHAKRKRRSASTWAPIGLAGVFSTACRF